MKQLNYKSLPFILFLFISSLGYAQAPQSFSYQAVARDLNGNILSDKTISLRFSIHDVTAVGAIVYQETQTTTTNTLGLANVSIGQGTPVSGDFTTIKWGVGAKFLELEIDPAGGNNYTSIGTSQMLSVPYALYAENAGSSKGTYDVIQADGTGGLTVTSSTTAFTLIPGLTTTFDLTDSSKIKISTTGGVDMESNAFNQWSYTDIAIFVDGAMQLPPGYQRVWAINTNQGPWTYFTILQTLKLGPGTHTVEVKAKWGDSSTGNVGLSGGDLTYMRGTVIVDILNH